MATQNQGTRQVKRKPVRLLCLPKLQLYTLQLICQVWDLIFLGGYHCLCSYFNFFISLWTKYLQQKQITLFFHLICLNKNIYLIFNLKLLISNKSDCSQCLGKKQLFWQLQQFQVVSNKLSLKQLIVARWNDMLSFFVRLAYQFTLNLWHYTLIFYCFVRWF